MKSDKSYRYRIIFPIGGKGGVGKSWIILLILQWLVSIGMRFRALDCDDENSTLTRFFSAAEFVRIRDNFAIDRLVQSTVESDVPVTLVDLPARCSDEFEKWFAVVPWEDMTAAGVRFTAIGVVEQSKDSLASILHWKEFLGDHVDYLIAVNRNAEDVGVYLESNARKKFLAAGITEIEIPKLDKLLVTELERTNLTVAGAITSPPAGSLLAQVMNRSRLRRYLASAFEQIEKGRGILAP